MCLLDNNSHCVQWDLSVFRNTALVFQVQVKWYLSTTPSPCHSYFFSPVYGLKSFQGPMNKTEQHLWLPQLNELEQIIQCSQMPYNNRTQIHSKVDPNFCQTWETSLLETCPIVFQQRNAKVWNTIKDISPIYITWSKMNFLKMRFLKRFTLANILKKLKFSYPLTRLTHPLNGKLATVSLLLT